VAKTPLQTIEAMLGQLSLEEVRDLRQTLRDLEALLEARAIVGQGTLPPDEIPVGEVRGYIEHKMIPNKAHTRLNGPYGYLRVWRNGKHTSKYLGKVKPG